jgi:hypothetical protein
LNIGIGEINMESTIYKCSNVRCGGIIAEKRQQWIHDDIRPVNSVITNVAIGQRNDTTIIDITYECNECKHETTLYEV